MCLAVAIRISLRAEVHCYDIGFIIIWIILDYCVTFWTIKCTYCLKVNIRIMMRHYLATVTMTFDGYFKHIKCTKKDIFTYVLSCT